VVKVERDTIADQFSTSGKISPVQEVKVVPKTPGKVARVLVDVGQTVAAGTMLLVLDNDDIQAKLDSARANLAVSDANLEKARIQLEKSQIQLEDAKRTLDRQKSLFEAKALSQSDYDAAQTSYNEIKKDVDMNAAGIASSQAGVEQSRAAVRQIEVDLENTMVRSPISGIITGRNVNAGEYVNNSTAAIVVDNIDSVEVNANLLEDEINYVTQGQEVKVLVAAVSSESFRGKVVRIGYSADEKAKTYPIWVAIDNPERHLKPGMFAEIRMEAVKKEEVLAVPSGAVVDRNGQKVVYLAQGDKSVERKVKTGVSAGGKTEITEGLSGGESVITSGLTSMKDGLAIKVQPQQQGQGASKTQGAAPGGGAGQVGHPDQGTAPANGKSSTQDASPQSRGN
jgi:RND family efflux transporter MFP subunit